MMMAFGRSMGGVLAPRVDVAEDGKAVTLTVELPGVNEKDIDVSLVGDQLTIKGEKRSEHEEKKDLEGHVVHRTETPRQRPLILRQLRKSGPCTLPYPPPAPRDAERPVSFGVLDALGPGRKSGGMAGRRRRPFGRHVPVTSLGDLHDRGAAPHRHTRRSGRSDDLSTIRGAIDAHKPDIAFNLVEEFDGIGHFDQHVVSYLELRKQAYTGCNPRGLTLARDKALTKKFSPTTV